MDIADHAKNYQDTLNQKALEQQRQSRKRYQAIMIDGKPCCEHCEEPLLLKRQSIGICVGCLTLEEMKARHYG